MTTDPNSFLMASGAKSAKFPTPGSKVTGTVEDLAVTQQTDMGGAPKHWDNGDPMMQLVVTLATDERDPDDPDDDGRRRLYLKGGNKATTSQGAVAAAVKTAGAKGLAEGGRLSIAYTGDGTPSKPGLNAPKQYTAKYEPPAPSTVAVDDIFAS